MSIPFSPRAALCTFAVISGLVAFGLSELPIGVGGFPGSEREGLLPITQGGSAAPDESGSILEAVLTHEALRPGRGNVCLRIAPHGATFIRQKELIASLEQAMTRRPELRERSAFELQRLRNPERAWLQPADPRLPQPPQPLSEEGTRQLRTAEIALISRPGMERPEVLLNMASLPAAFQATGPGCRSLSFTAPAVAGDLAFVEIDYAGAPGAADDWLYAVVRRDQTWQIEAISALSS